MGQEVLKEGMWKSEHCREQLPVAGKENIKTITNIQGKHNYKVPYEAQVD